MDVTRKRKIQVVRNLDNADEKNFAEELRREALGPRTCESTGKFIPYTLLGEPEDLEVWNREEKILRVKQAKLKGAPRKPSVVRKQSTQRSLQVQDDDNTPRVITREERIMLRWQHHQQSWGRFKEKMAARLGKHIDELVMSKSDDYREMIEEYDLIQKAMPSHMKHGPEYWMMSLRGEGTRFVQVGNAFSGLFCPVKENPAPLAEMIRRPQPLHRNKKVRTWRDNPVLKRRKRLLASNLKQLRPHVVTSSMAEGLVVVGADLFEWADQFYEDVESARIHPPPRLKERGGGPKSAVRFPWLCHWQSSQLQWLRQR